MSAMCLLPNPQQAERCQTLLASVAIISRAAILPILREGQSLYVRLAHPVRPPKAAPLSTWWRGAGGEVRRAARLVMAEIDSRYSSRRSSRPDSRALLE